MQVRDDNEVAALVRERIDSHFLADLYASGLRDKTIAQAGLYVERDPFTLARMLKQTIRRARKFGPCLIFPFHDLNGQRIPGFCRAKPTVPPLDENGKPSKYLHPSRIKRRAYFPLGSLVSIRNPSQLLLITEGEKKALAATQAGFPCIGLGGVNAWAVSEEDMQRVRASKDDCDLIPDLAAINWSDRQVGIVFDTDTELNGDVEREASKLIITLQRLHARPFLVQLPLGPPDSNGNPSKVGMDDLLVNLGASAMREIVERDRSPPPTDVRPLSDIRRDLQKTRSEIVGVPGIYLDRGQTGAGKTTADVKAAEAAGRSLITFPTHKLGKEMKEIMSSAGLISECYPDHTSENCKNLELVKKSLEHGLQARCAVCENGCEFRKQCEISGYLADLKSADQASHRIATHKRAEHTLKSLATGIRFISFHEDASNILRPTISVRNAIHFAAVAQIADLACKDAWEEWDNDSRYFLFKLGEVARIFQAEMATGDKTRLLEIEPTATWTQSVDRLLWQAMKQANLWPDGDAMRLAKAATAKDLGEFYIQVDAPLSKGGRVQLTRSAIAVGRAAIPPTATVVISDATAIAEEIELLLDGTSVVDITPSGTAEVKKPIVQIQGDVTTYTCEKTLIKTLHNVLLANPTAMRAGVICHQKHEATVNGGARSGVALESDLQKRIVKTGHFFGADSRGSNDWIGECDLLIVLGTPRVPPPAIRQKLLRAGQLSAASIDGKWKNRSWQARTVAGELLTVTTSGYRNRLWDLAYRSIVRAELLQAVGRGRGIMDEGIPVVIVSRENLGFPIAELGQEKPIGWKERQAAAIVRRLSDKNAKAFGGQTRHAIASKLTDKSAKDTILALLSVISVATAVVAEEMKVEERTARRWLTASEGTLVRRVSERGGWLPMEPEPLAQSLVAVASADAAASPPVEATTAAA